MLLVRRAIFKNKIFEDVLWQELFFVVIAACNIFYGNKIIDIKRKNFKHRIR